MKQHKFRIWLDDKGKYEYFELKDFSQDNYLSDYLEESLIEEFTGAKDKDGREIYEGDIICPKDHVGDKDEDDYYEVVEWNEHHGCWGSGDEGEEICPHADWQKVIDSKKEYDRNKANEILYKNMYVEFKERFAEFLEWKKGKEKVDES